MGKRGSPGKFSAREKRWEKIVNALVELSNKLQNDGEILRARVINLQKDMYKTKMEQKVDTLKAKLYLGLIERGSIIHQHRYENAESDLANFREWCGYLVHICSGTTDALNGISEKGESSRNKALRDEVRKLKSEIESYKLEKNSEISALLSEKNFVWNQFNQMENHLSEELKNKCHAVENANEKVQILVSRADELAMTNEQLRANISKMESDSINKEEEISALRKEIEILKARSGSASTSQRPCTAEAPSSSRRGKNNSATLKSIAKVKKESHPSQTTETRNGSSKRKAIDVIVIPDTPKLFSSSFKVPKLKNSSSRKIV